MAHGIEPQMEEKILTARRQREALEQSLRTNVTASTNLEISLQHEVTRESINVGKNDIPPELHLERKLSSELLEHRERLHGGEVDLDQLAQRTSRDKYIGLKQAKITNLDSSTRESRTPVQIEIKGLAPSAKNSSILSDPLGFLANLIKKLEKFLLGKFKGEETALEELEKLNQPKIKVKRKKRGLFAAKKSTGFYNLDQASEAEELVDLETALAESAPQQSRPAANTK